MGVNRLNHAVLYVRDADRAARFYEEVLGFSRVSMGDGQPIPGAVFLQAPGSTNDHDLGLFSIGEGAGPSTAGRAAVGLYHLAWEVDTLDDLERLAGSLAERGALVGASDHSTTKSLYARDPDGLEFEVAWVGPPTSSTAPPWPGAHASSRSTSRPRRPVTGLTPPAASASPGPLRPDARSALTSPASSGPTGTA
jgi:catechol 2,3-dioxygenase-like lactoylglutathione lyase family enzyme